MCSSDLVLGKAAFDHQILEEAIDVWIHPKHLTANVAKAAKRTTTLGSSFRPGGEIVRSGQAG